MFRRKKIKTSLVPVNTGLASFPPEIILYVFNFLDSDSLSNMAFVSHYFRDLAEDDSLKNNVKDIMDSFLHQAYKKILLPSHTLFSRKTTKSLDDLKKTIHGVLYVRASYSALYEFIYERSFQPVVDTVHGSYLSHMPMSVIKKNKCQAVNKFIDQSKELLHGEAWFTTNCMMEEAGLICVNEINTTICLLICLQYELKNAASTKYSAILESTYNKILDTIYPNKLAEYESKLNRIYKASITYTAERSVSQFKQIKISRDIEGFLWSSEKTRKYLRPLFNKLAEKASKQAKEYDLILPSVVDAIRESITLRASSSLKVR